MENSTPLEETSAADTPEATPVDTLETGTEPADKTTGPESDSPKADATDTHPAEQLIFGKYKNIEEAEKGYKEAEKAVTKAAELEKQLKAYQDIETQARQQRELSARKLGFQDAEEQQVRADVANHEFKRYCEALETMLTGDNYTNAYKALFRYQQSGNTQYLDMAKEYFPASAVSKISSDVALYADRAMNEYFSKKSQQQQEYYKEQLENFAQNNADWLARKQRQDALGLLIQLSGGNVDFAAAKTVIDALEAEAIADFNKKQGEIRENQEVQNSLRSPAGAAEPVNRKKWLTKEEYYNLSPEQEKANYDLITEQISLEKQGKLPKMLT